MTGRKDREYQHVRMIELSACVPKRAISGEGGGERNTSHCDSHMRPHLSLTCLHRSAFRVFDLDGDGQITRAELAQVANLDKYIQIYHDLSISRLR